MIKYAIWRHESSLGNSAEHTIGLYKHFVRNNIKEFEIYVEYEFQKYFALCIPFVKEQNIKFLDKEAAFDFHLSDYSKKFLIPNVYREKMSYPASWADLSQSPDCTLQFPLRLYKNEKKLPENAIIIQLRERGTYNKRHVGANEEPYRFVGIKTFFTIALYYANLGFTVVRLGDSNQTPMPKHKNIFDFAMEKNKTMLDDLFLIDNCKVFISCDSGIWPMAGGMKKNLVLCNILSSLDLSKIVFNNKKASFAVKKSAITDWLPKETTELLFKTPDFTNGLPKDNFFTEILVAAERFL